MEFTTQEKENKSNIFKAIPSLNIIECLVLKSLVRYSQYDKVMIKEISYSLLTDYWHLDTKSFEGMNEIKLLHSIRNKLVKYGLDRESGKEDILQVLKYIGNRAIDIELYTCIKVPLKTLSYPIDRIEGHKKEYWRQMLGIRNNKEAQFYEQKGNEYVEFTQRWVTYIRSHEGIQASILERIKELQENKGDGELSKLECLSINQVEKQLPTQNFEILDQTEKYMLVHLSINKKEYTCLEHTLEDLEITFDKYVDLHSAYITYFQQFLGKATAKKYPLVTAALLIYTAVYRYNDDEGGGYWPEFFGGENTYLYQRDVPPMIEALGKIANRYSINTQVRHYMQKTNLSEIFSHIYVPEVSLKKIFSAIYSYYYKNNKASRFFSIAEFMNFNEYRLDKPGSFFISEDVSIENTFNKVLQLMEVGVSEAGRIDESIELPKRFFNTFKEWYEVEKKVLDSKKEEFYISSPKIRFDTINQKLILYLPKQKSREYSDEGCGWWIKTESKKEFVEGRIVREKSGNYLVLDEILEVDQFETLELEYIFNDRVIGKWQYSNSQPYILFDQEGVLLQKNVVKREGCIIGLKKESAFQLKQATQVYHSPKWSNYIFYEMFLRNYESSTIDLTPYGIIKVEEQPVVDRINFKVLFEDWNKWPIYEGVKIYEVFGSIYFDAPYLSKNDFEVKLINEETREEINLENLLIPLTEYRLGLEIRNLLEVGVYQLWVRYKNKVIYREGFAICRNVCINNEFKMLYEAKEERHKKLIVAKDKTFGIVASHYGTMVNDRENNYEIVPSHGAVAEFSVKIFEREISIRKIIRPIAIEILGIDAVMSQKNSSQVTHITKQVFNTQDIRLQITNYDNRQEWLIYSMVIQNYGNDSCIRETHKLRFGETFTWQLKTYRDRILDYENIGVLLEVISEKDILLHRQKLLEVTQTIEMLDFKRGILENVAILRWREKERNKKRVITLHNFTSPHDQPVSFELEEGQTQLEIDLKKLKYGIYRVRVDYRKEVSLFESINTEKNFIKRSEVDNCFANKIGIKENHEEAKFSKIILSFIQGKHECVMPLLESIDFTKIDLYPLYCILIQIRYSFQLKENKDMEMLIRVNRYVMKQLTKQYSQDTLMKEIYGLEEDFKEEDRLYLTTIIAHFNRGKDLSIESIEELAEFNLIDALCGVKSGGTKLPSNLVIKCKEQFDHELLSKAKDYKALYSIVDTEIERMSDFWNWLVEYRNKNLLKKNYSKARMFRIYQQEKGITTYKVLGFTMDDLVYDEVVEQSIMLQTVLQKRSSGGGELEEVYRGFYDLVQIKHEGQYKDILLAAFMSVAQPETYTDYMHFELMMKVYFSKKKNLFNRYRAYFKLIFM